MDNYDRKTAQLLARIQLLCGIFSMFGAYVLGFTLLSCVCLFCLAGVVALLASRAKSEVLVLTSLLTSIGAAICAGYWCLAFSLAIASATNLGPIFSERFVAVFWILLVIDVVELLVAIWSAALASEASVCPRSKPKLFTMQKQPVY